MSREEEQARAVDLPPNDERGRAGENLRKAYPIEESSCFAQLLRDIDEVCSSRNPPSE